VNAAVWSGKSTVFERRLFFVLLVGHEKSKQFILWRASAFRGMDITQQMKSHLLMMTGTLCSLASGVAGIMIVAITNTLSGMRKGK